MLIDAPQTILLSIHDLPNHKYWAFKQMQLGQAPLATTRGLKFYKILGTGGGNGFSMWPNFSQYALLTVWNKKEDALNFLSENSFFKEYSQHSDSVRLFQLLAVYGHGSWDGQKPFEHHDMKYDDELPHAVITRARIRAWRLLEFWKHVPSVSQSIEGRPGLKLAVGIGEWPLVQQATFSVWDDLESIKAYAYQSKLHGAVVRKTRDRQWYGEEMFTRFRVLLQKEL